MTVGEKLHQCLAQLEGAVSSLKTFCLDTQDQTAKKLYAQLSDTLQNQVVNPLKSRVNYVESQEPQYKVYEQAMKQGEMPEPQQPEQYDH
jgi:hypothetical protein